jgi:hypothetical protein
MLDAFAAAMIDPLLPVSVNLHFVQRLTGEDFGAAIDTAEV